ncbi:MAG: DMT family transporter [Deltaproteobacteria bacterium]|nr:DMT family transporter [Deltaproteobacteria bacterium]
MSSENALASSSRLHLAAATLCVLFWGGSFAVTRSAVTEVPPMTLALLRFALASLILWPVSRRLHGRIRLARRDRWDVLGLALCGVTLYHAFENLALRHTSASVGSLIISTVPLATAVAESITARSFPSRPAMVGLCAGFAGVLFLMDGAESGHASFLGNVLMGAAVICWVGYTGLVRRLGGRYPDLWLAAMITGVGAAGLVPFAAAEWLRGTVRLPSAAGWASLLYLGALCSALAYVLWSAAVRVLGTVPTNSLIYGMPLVGVLSGALFLGEPLSVRLLCGGVLIVAGVAVASWSTLGAGQDPA